MALSWKFAIAFVGLVILVLLVNGAVNMWLSYGQAKSAAIQVQREKALAAAERVSQFVAEIENQIGWTTRVEWSRIPLEQQRYDFIRLLRQVPAITELSYIDGKGKEQLKVSRLEPDSVGSGHDFSGDPRFLKAVSDKAWFGPVYFRRGSEPYMTIAVAHAGREPGVTVAEVNLKLIWDVITAIRVGEKGYAYVVDGKGRLIAHPDLSLVLRDTDLSQLPQVKMALAEGSAAQPGSPQPDAQKAGAAEIASAVEGGSVLTAHAAVPRLGWIVFVQLPLAEALEPVYASLIQTLALLGLGLLLALIIGGWLARRMVVPIRRLQQGAERLGGGDLSQRIDIRTGDEIETLADRFNQMAGKVQESYETLEAKVEERTHDLNEALQRQGASAEILRVISGSPTDVKPVFDAIVLTATKLFGCNSAGVFLVDGKHLTRVTGVRSGRPDLEHEQAPPIPIDAAANFPSRAVVEERTVHVSDYSSIDLPEHEQWIRKHFGVESGLFLPLLRKGECIGVLLLTGSKAGIFGEKEIALAESFRDQTLIAIDNTRLFKETQEALEQQTATAEVLQAISRSVFDLETVLSTLIDTAARLCRGSRGTIFLRHGDRIEARAFHSNVPSHLRNFLLNLGMTMDDPGFVAETIRTGRVVHLPDLVNDPSPLASQVRAHAPFGAVLCVPLMRHGEAIGCFGVPREEPIAFTQREIELVQTFADQAVIAIENARLFDEVQAKTRDLTESLEHQTATSEVLQVISSSPGDLTPVFQTILSSATRICECQFGVFFLFENGVFNCTSVYNLPPAFAEAFSRSPTIVPPATDPLGRLVSTKQVIHIADARNEPDYLGRFPPIVALVELGGARTVLIVPMIKENNLVGAIGFFRQEVHLFTEKQIGLVASFANQAIIAIENVRLLTELRRRTDDLSESLAQQTATADVLKAISRSALDLKSVLTTLTQSAVRLCGAAFGVVFQRDGDLLRVRAESGCPPDLFEHLVANPIGATDRGSFSGRVVMNGEVVHLPDILADPEFTLHSAAALGQFRAALGVPLKIEGRVEGVFGLVRHEPGPFSARQIEMVETFADQAVIAIDNARLFDEVQERTRELSQSLANLRAAQDRLIQSEKLASLGQLTAGIAHEIKNPLNFVNNFAALSGELISEVRELIETAKLDDKLREEIDELTDMLKGNLEKVVQHGKRADSIVKNMLLHSRESGGEHRPIDLNAVVEESVNLAYHGARAEKPGFNITLVKHLDPAVGEVDLYPQEFQRVLLNLISNGFYAATKRKAQSDGAAFEPTLTASTKNLGDKVEIKIRDNGTGIPDEVKAKMFNPFFTTKPAGEGTGLGLSLSYDIVVKQHGGTIGVDTKPGDFTEFTIVLPRAGNAGPSQRA